MSLDPDLRTEIPIVQIFPEAREAWFYHHCPNSSWDTSAARLPIGDGGWLLVDENSITPSILCDCGLHGFWTNGEWRQC